MVEVRDEFHVVIGTRVRVEATFVDEDAAAITGATVTAQAKTPAGTILGPVAATEVPADSGTYRASFDADIAGRWHVRVECDAPLSAKETSFYVDESDVE